MTIEQATPQSASPYIIEFVKILGSLAVGVGVGIFLRRRRFQLSIVFAKPSAKGQIPGYLLDLPEELHQSLNKIHWNDIGRRFQKQEDIALLQKQLRCLKVFYKATPIARGVLDSSISKLESSGVDDVQQKNIIYDVLSSKILGSTLIGMANRQALDLLPLPKEGETPSSKKILEFHEEELGGGQKGVLGRFLIEYPDRQFSFMYDNPKHREMQCRLVLSLAYALPQKFCGYLRTLKEELLTEIELANQIIDNLEPLLFNKSRWLVAVQLTNVGASPIALGSSGELYAKCGGKKYGPMRVIYRRDVQVTAANRHDDKESQAEKDIATFGVSLDPKDEVATENIIVAPGESSRLYLLSENAIDSYNDGTELLSFWERGLPEYKIKMKLIPHSLVYGGWASSHWLKV